LGPQDKLKRASIQAEVFLNSQRQFMDMTKGPKPPAQSTYAVSREVWVDSSLVGLIVGSQGSQVKKLAEQFGVQIFIEKGNGEKRKITINGKNEKDVEAAVEEIALEKAYVPFDNSIIEYVYGHKMKNLDFFYEKSGVV